MHNEAEGQETPLRSPVVFPAGRRLVPCQLVAAVQLLPDVEASMGTSLPLTVTLPTAVQVVEAQLTASSVPSEPPVGLATAVAVQVVPLRVAARPASALGLL
jgi:hypothetical protein